MPQISTPSMPEFPEISQDNNLYKPSLFFEERQPPVTSEKKTFTQEAQKEKNTSSVPQNANNALNSAMLNTIGNALTSKDIANLDSSGLASLSNIILQKNASGSDSSLLQEILVQLNMIKAQLNEKSTMAEVKFNEKPALLRLNINGKDIMSTCKNVYLSKAENDETFLLTFDRNVIINDEKIFETVYMLFTMDKTLSNASEYLVDTQLSQSKETIQSQFYTLSQQKALRAYRTGSLISLHIKDNELFSLDLLMDCGK